MVFEFEYFWAILLLFVMERICCLQEQFDKDFCNLPDPERSIESLSIDMEDFANKEYAFMLPIKFTEHVGCIYYAIYMWFSLGIALLSYSLIFLK